MVGTELRFAARALTIAALSLGLGGVPVVAHAAEAKSPVVAQTLVSAVKAEAAAEARAARVAAAKKASRMRPRVSVPAYGRISARFGATSRLWSNRHTGMDIDARYGSRVRAAVAGTVIKATYDRSYGRIVVVRGGGVDIWYAHLSKDSVKVGQRVKRGQVIGRVGSSGNSTGSHLHLEVRKNDRPTNPATFLWGSHRGKPGDSPKWTLRGIAKLSDL